MRNFKRGKKLPLSAPFRHGGSVFHPAPGRLSGGNSEACGLFYFHGWSMKTNYPSRHLNSLETTATAAFGFVISVKSDLSDGHPLIVKIWSIWGCYGDRSSWKRRDAICVIARPYSHCTGCRCSYIAQVTVCRNASVPNKPEKNTKRTIIPVAWLTCRPPPPGRRRPEPC